MNWYSNDRLGQILTRGCAVIFVTLILAWLLNDRFFSGTILVGFGVAALLTVHGLLQYFIGAVRGMRTVQKG